jgi:hypothetical protein
MAAKAVGLDHAHNISAAPVSAKHKTLIVKHKITVMEASLGSHADVLASGRHASFEQAPESYDHEQLA